MNDNLRVLIPCRTVVEAIDEKPEADKQDGVVITGKLITCGMPTRNGISYTQQSMESFTKRFNSRNKKMPFLDSHDDSSIRHSPPFGHITEFFMRGQEVFYKANIDPEEKMFLHKLKRGDISEVSLQAIVDAKDEVEEMNGDSTIIADVREVLEVSGVLIPGARDTSVEIQEGFITEKRLSEAFKHSIKHGINVRESLKQLRAKEAKDNNELAGGQVKKPREEEEELDTGNGDALFDTQLGKKIRKVPESIVKKSKYLKVITKRFR